MRVKGNKRTLFASIISMILCVAMLLGTTLAWFTDTVTNTGNRIQNGYLKVDLLMDKQKNGNYVSIRDGVNGDIFSEATGNGVRWEPGKTEVVFLQVKNDGDLALNYNIIVDVQDPDTTDEVMPESAMEYAIIDGYTAENFNRAIITDWNIIANNQLVQEVHTGPLPTGKVLAAENGALLANESDYFALAVHMKEDAGNEYQGKVLNIDVQLAAKQMASEKDSISDKYDVDAAYGDDKWVIPTYVDVFEGIGDYEKLNLAHAIGRSDTAAKATDLISDGIVPSGNQYLFVEEGIGYGGLQQKASDNVFVAGKEYTFVAWVKIDEDSNGQITTEPQLEVTFYTYDEEGNQIDKTVINKEPITGLQAGEWKEVSFTFTAPEELKNGLRKFSVFRIWKDKVSGKRIGLLSLDNVRIYTEVDTSVSELSDADAFRAMLAEEAAVSQNVENKVFSKYGERTLLQGASNLVVDGTFSNPTLNAEGSAWLAKEQFAKRGTWVSDSHTNDGSGALQITTDDANEAPWYYQEEVMAADTDAVYQLSYWYKINAGTTGYPYVKVETFADRSIPGAENKLYDQYSIVPEEGYQYDGEWHKAIMNFAVSDGTYSIRLLPRFTDGVGTVLLDDIELYMTQPDEMMGLSTEYKFYYDDELGNTEFTVTFLSKYFPELTDVTADFQVYDGETLLWENTGVTFAEGENDTKVATTQFDLTTFLLKRNVPYCVKATLYDKDGKELDADSTNIFITNRPEYLTKDGVYLANGETPFYPVIGYHVDAGYRTWDETYVEVLKKAKEAGINTVQLTGSGNPVEVLQQLDACKEAGVMGLMNLYMNQIPAGAGSNIGYNSKTLSDERIVNHPALFGFLIDDEPYLNNPEIGMDLENSYRLIRQYDTKHPIMAVEIRMNDIKKTSKYVDILITDFYKSAKSHLVHDLTCDAVEIMNNRPVYNLIKTYCYSYFRDFPTGSAARNNAWQVLLGGGSGVGYFSITDGYDIDLYDKDPEKNKSLALWDIPDGVTGHDVWESLIEFGTKEMTLAYDHFVFEKSPDFNESLIGDYWYSSWEVDGSIYMVVLGMMDDDKSVPASISLTSDNGLVSITSGTVEKIAGDADGIIENGQLKLTVEGVDVTLYKITPDTAVDFSSLD